MSQEAIQKPANDIIKPSEPNHNAATLAANTETPIATSEAVKLQNQHQSKDKSQQNNETSDHRDANDKGDVDKMDVSKEKEKDDKVVTKCETNNGTSLITAEKNDEKPELKEEEKSNALEEVNADKEANANKEAPKTESPVVDPVANVKNVDVPQKQKEMQIELSCNTQLNDSSNSTTTVEQKKTPTRGRKRLNIDAIVAEEAKRDIKDIMETPAAADDNRRLTRSRTRGGAPTPPTPPIQETRGRKRTNSGQSSASKKGKKSDVPEDLSKPDVEQNVEGTLAREEEREKASEVVGMNVDEHTQKSSESQEEKKGEHVEQANKEEDKKDELDDTKSKLPETSEQTIDSEKVVANVKGDEPNEPGKTGDNVPAKNDESIDKVAEKVTD